MLTKQSKMNPKKIPVTESLLNKFASFTSLALQEIHALRQEIADGKIKQAEEEVKATQFVYSVKQAANALYDSDLDFIDELFDKKEFVKKAQADPSYLAKVVTKLCNTATTTSLGSTVAASLNKRAAFHDPVYAEAFGYTKTDPQIINWD